MSSIQAACLLSIAGRAGCRAFRAERPGVDVVVRLRVLLRQRASVGRAGGRARSPSSCHRAPGPPPRTLWTLPSTELRAGGDETMVFCRMGPGSGEYLTPGFRGAAVFQRRSQSVSPTWRPPRDKSVNLLQSSTEISTENSHALLSLPHVHLAFTHSNTDDNPKSQWLRAPLPRRTGLCSRLCLQPPASRRVQAGLCARSRGSNQSSPGSRVLPTPCSNAEAASNHPCP